MRNTVLIKNVISGLLVLSAATSNAAPKVGTMSSKIDKEIEAMATGSLNNSKARVKKAQAKKPITKVANPAAAATNQTVDTTVFDAYKAPSSKSASTVATKVKTEASQKSGTQYSGSVGITVGKDSNATVEKTKIDFAPNVPVSGSFYEITPSVGFKNDLLSGHFGARIKDFTSQGLSDNAKETQINADLDLNYSLGLLKAQTKVDFENADSKYPDYISGTTKGMPIRYFQTRISQDLSVDLGQLNLAIGGSFANKDFTTPYLDNPSDHIFGQKIFEQDQRITEGKLRIGAKLAENLEIAVRPLIRHTQFLEEPARQTNGQKGGAYFDPSTPRREVLKQEGNVDFVFSTGRVNITPTFTFGNDSDEAFGALDNTYRGAALKAELIIDPGTNLKLNGSFNYKEVDYDNWTYNGLNNVIANGAKRKDTEKTTTAGISVNVTKNIGFGVNYTLIEEVSNWETPDENYKQEIVGSTLTVSF